MRKKHFGQHTTLNEQDNEKGAGSAPLQAHTHTHTKIGRIKRADGYA